ncbi:MAG: YdcH family protein [Glycocaulis sp.]|uniref:YdcH family protein n=1 Tax=Glycocaulis sp. TaxID=1969725 RepID=UPI003F71170C
MTGVWLRMFGDLDEDALIAKLAELRREHRALDAEVRAAQDCGVVDQLKLVRLKRRKLMLKDMIFALEDQLNPDIIA